MSYILHILLNSVLYSVILGVMKMKKFKRGCLFTTIIFCEIGITFQWLVQFCLSWILLLLFNNMVLIFLRIFICYSEDASETARLGVLSISNHEYWSACVKCSPKYAEASHVAICSFSRVPVCCFFTDMDHLKRISPSSFQTVKRFLCHPM